jgi:ABC-2 type transport system ATP-binding protein
MIEVRALDKAIKGRTILSNISFEIRSGECVALIGPNGAGKTTLLSCLLGDRKATKGQVLLDGLAPQAQSNKEKVAVLPQENAIPTDLKVKELLRFFQAIYKDSLTDVEIDSLLCFSPEQKNQLAGKLSGGQKRLLAFVICLIGKPKLLFLDEPTAGMDTSTRQRFWEIVHDLKEKGVTIFYTSHYIEEVEHTAERILVLHQGRLLRDTTPFAMRSEEQEKEVTLSIAFAVSFSIRPTTMGF